MSEAPTEKASKLQRPLVFGLMALAAIVGLGAIRLATPASSAPQGASAAPQSVVQRPRPTWSVYKIPVSMSQPALGPEDALVTLVEWCDLPDAGCKEVEPAIQALLQAHPKDVRLVFRHLAISGTVAHQFAQVAHQSGKFWEARKLLLEQPGPVTEADVERLAPKLGMEGKATRRAVESRPYAGHIAADRIFARMFDVSATPALFANGRPLKGPVTTASLEALFKEEEARAQALLAKGTARKDLYLELTKDGTWTALPKELIGRGT